MKIRIGLFCSLSTSPKWRVWLNGYDSDLYKSFSDKMKNSSGCSENSDIMKGILKTINDNNRSDELIDFLKKDFPNILINEQSVNINQNDDVFRGYKPGILTYPHRIILNKNDRDALDDLIRNSSAVDYVIVGGNVYVEYLNKDEKNLVQSIPRKNWLVSNYKEKIKSN